MGYLQLLKDTNIDFMRYRWVAMALSAILVIIGFIACYQIFTGHANLGIEFTGGTSLTLEFANQIELDEARALLISNNFAAPQVTNSQDATKFKLFIRVKEGDVSEVPDQILSIFKTKYPDNTITIVNSNSIGPAVGNELRDKALYAILYSILGIIIYIAIRFDWKFGLAATISMFHSALAIVGLMWLKDFIVPTEFTLLIMTAVLTMAGYSLTDTVVVFDRIRENLRRRTKMPLEQTLNNSINQVLSRTIVTSTTVFLVSLAIFLLGGEVLSNFALALLIGVVIGTYSSIFIASPFLILFRGGRGGLLAGAVEAKAQTTQRAKSSA
ncbi:protein translocase subunit SecF [Candidatus Acetothermia bacterium]|nr:protein translocase subunit SecF [Candidatus Acetothermia bacterium]MBI3643815.1 protein translocase subunit SecF [Candidatus Acetothermia bacterium]